MYYDIVLVNNTSTLFTFMISAISIVVLSYYLGVKQIFANENKLI